MVDLSDAPDEKKLAGMLRKAKGMVKLAEQNDVLINRVLDDIAAAKKAEYQVLDMFFNNEKGKDILKAVPLLAEKAKKALEKKKEIVQFFDKWLQLSAKVQVEINIARNKN